jgi:N6-adenosine-specific RNA methylase IME4
MNKVTILPPTSHSRREWAKKIKASWKLACSSAIGAFIQTGRDLIAAKDDLTKRVGHGEWMKLVGTSRTEGELPFGYKTAQKLMAIARDTFLTKRTHESILPPDYNTLYQLERLRRRFPDTFAEWLEDGRITPSLQRNEINKVLRLERVQEDEQRVLNLQPIAGKFRTLVLDPAWEYAWLSLAGRAKPGYAMQSIEQLMALDVRAWADDETGTHLYLWTTNNFMGEATKLVAHWGFQHRTLITWIKPPPFGLGSYFRNSTEHCLFATLGKTTTRPEAASIKTHFEAPRGEHSEKPDVFYDLVRLSSYPPYGEGNQRTAREDFTNLYCPATDAPESYKPAEAAE